MFLRRHGREQESRAFATLGTSCGEGCSRKTTSSQDISGEPTKQRIEDALCEAETAPAQDHEDAADDMVDIPKGVMEVKPESEKAEPVKDKARPDSDVRAAAESTGDSSSSSSSSSDIAAKAADKSSKVSAPKTLPKNKGRGRGGRGRGRETASPDKEISRKRPVPIDTSGVKINAGLKARLDLAARNPVPQPALLALRSERPERGSERDQLKAVSF